MPPGLMETPYVTVRAMKKNAPPTKWLVCWYLLLICDPCICGYLKYFGEKCSFFQRAKHAGGVEAPTPTLAVTAVGDRLSALMCTKAL